MSHPGSYMVSMAEHERWTVVAARQHGVVARRQLRASGLTDKAVLHAVAAHRLAWLSPRVLRSVGSADTALQRATAAALDATDGVVALHSALALWQTAGYDLEPIHVLTTRTPHRGGSHLGIVHSSVRLGDHDVAHVEGMRVTTPVRTLVDLSSRLHPARLESVCDDLVRRRLLPLETLHAAVGELPRRGGPAGYAALRRLVSARPVGQQATGSRLERRFEQVLERAGEAPFDRQMDLGDDQGWIGRVDFVDRRLRIVVEIQSTLYHGTVSDRRRDRHRLARLRADGWIVVEVTEDEVWHHAERAVAKVRAARALASASAA